VGESGVHGDNEEEEVDVHGCGWTVGVGFEIGCRLSVGRKGMEGVETRMEGLYSFCQNLISKVPGSKYFGDKAVRFHGHRMR
jgi:hypothetical protein